MAQGTKKRTAAAKNSSPRKAGVKKTAKKTVKKTAGKKLTVRKTTGKKSKKKNAPAKKRAAAPETAALDKQTPAVVPGPAAIEVPPVEEPAIREQAIGVVTHYYSHLGVAVVQLNAGALRTGGRIRIKGHTTDFTQTVGSIEYEHLPVDEAVAGQCVGLKIIDHAREHDIVYRE